MIDTMMENGGECASRTQPNECDEEKERVLRMDWNGLEGNEADSLRGHEIPLVFLSLCVCFDDVCVCLYICRAFPCSTHRERMQMQ